MTTMTTPRIYNTNTVFEVDDDFDLLQRNTKVYNNASARKPEPLLATFSDDPVALSIQSYLIWKTNPHRRWVPVDEVGRVTPEARQMAQELRTYFLHRNTMKVLQGQTPTEFQYKMNGPVATTFVRLQKMSWACCIACLTFGKKTWPWIKCLKVLLILKLNQQARIFRFRHMTTHVRLTPVREVLKSRKSGDFVQFWFADSAGERYVYAVRADNSMISLFRSLFKRESIQVKAQAMLNRLPGSHIRTSYWKLSGLELE
jgi:hypothetical protein